LVDNTVTVRDRDTMNQVRVPIDNLRTMIFDELKPKR
jgi:glycyl-tRNA synthetase (class II)